MAAGNKRPVGQTRLPLPAEAIVVSLPAVIPALHVHGPMCLRLLDFHALPLECALLASGSICYGGAANRDAEVDGVAQPRIAAATTAKRIHFLNDRLGRV